jgi:L-aspartate oxidase
LRLFMWDYVGIVRSNKRLERALRRINLLKQEVDEYYSYFKVSNNMLELRNLLCVAQLIVSCAIKRKESRGLHYNLDYPNLLDDSGPTIINKNMPL